MTMWQCAILAGRSDTMCKRFYNIHNQRYDINIHGIVFHLNNSQLTWKVTSLRTGSHFFAYRRAVY